jgi:SOS response regulatory protein OraA/RecX
MPTFITRKADNSEDLAKIKKIVISQAGEKNGVNKSTLVAGLLRAGFKQSDIDAAIQAILLEGKFEEVSKA